MKHPFDAILSTDDDASAATPTRRQMIGRAVSASAIVVGLGGVDGLGNMAEANSSNDKPGSEGSASSPKPPSVSPLKPTTKRKGEEGGLVTTQAIGEEGGAGPFPGATTKAVGEEGGRLPGGGTTKRVGEEGGFRGPPPKPRKFAELKKHYDAATKKGDAFAASSSFAMMRSHPEANAHKTLLAKADAELFKAGSAILAEAKAAAKKGDINTAFEKTRSLEFYFAQVDVVMQASKFHVELRTNEKYKKGYKQATREFAAKEQFTQAQSFKSTLHKRQTYQSLARHYADTVYGKKAAEALKKLTPRKLKPQPKPNPGRVTTLAIGEEG